MKKNPRIVWCKNKFILIQFKNYIVKYFSLKEKNYNLAKKLFSIEFKKEETKKKKHQIAMRLL
jgi:hypothetical protein